MTTSLSRAANKILGRLPDAPPVEDLPTLFTVGTEIPSTADLSRQIEIEDEELARLDAYPPQGDAERAKEGIVWPAKQRAARIAKRALLRKMLDDRSRADAHYNNAERLFAETRARVDEFVRYRALRELLGESTTRALAEPTTTVEALKSIYLAQLELAAWADATGRPTLAAEARARCEALAERIREKSQ